MDLVARFDGGSIIRWVTAVPRAGIMPNLTR
jgi:hypothetical protein